MDLAPLSSEETLEVFRRILDLHDKGDERRSSVLRYYLLLSGKNELESMTQAVASA